jgi:hypothetical protein
VRCIVRVHRGRAPFRIGASILCLLESASHVEYVDLESGVEDVCHSSEEGVEVLATGPT